MYRHFTGPFCAAAAAITLTTAGPAGAALAAPSPTAAPFSGRLYGVAAVSASDAWAAGLNRSEMVILHWNGTAWTQAVTPSLGFLISAAATSASSAWTVGGTDWFGSQTLIEHWNGTAWTRVPSAPDPTAISVAWPPRHPAMPGQSV